MSLTTEIEKTKRGLSLEKRCWLNSNWNTIRLLDHNWSYSLFSPINNYSHEINIYFFHLTYFLFTEVYILPSYKVSSSKLKFIPMRVHNSGYFLFISDSFSQVSSSIWDLFHNIFTKGTFLFHNSLSLYSKILVAFLPSASNIP